MLKPTCCENISKTNLDKLNVHGFQYFEDVVESKSSWIRDIFESVAKCETDFVIESALDLWLSESAQEPVCEAPGVCVRPGQILEVCGGPGQGKTQLCLQMCVSTQLARPGAEALYLDTAANFSADRLKEITMTYKYQFEEMERSTDTWTWKPQHVLRKIHFLEVSGTAQFCAAISLLDDFLVQHPQVRLIVIDSITFPFKDGCPEMKRTGILYRTAAKLRRLALHKNIAVVLTNEVNVRIGLGAPGALGDSWAHLPSRRLLLAPPLLALTHCGTNRPPTRIQITQGGIGKEGTIRADEKLITG